MILRLSDAHPYFRKMYEQVYSLCQNTEGLLDMFSEELRILDRNTVQYMIDEMQDEIDAQQVTIEEQSAQLQDKDAQLQESYTQLQDKDAQLQESYTQLQDKDAKIAELEAKLKQFQG